MGRKSFDGRVKLTALRPLRLSAYRAVEPGEQFVFPATRAASLIEFGLADFYGRPDTREAAAVELALRLRALARQQGPKP